MFLVQSVFGYSITYDTRVDKNADFCGKLLLAPEPEPCSTQNDVRHETEDQVKATFGNRQNSRSHIKSHALDHAINAAVMGGIHFAVAAGDDNRNSCDYSPSAAQLAVTVGASTLDDTRACFSNHGKSIDIFTPGLKIQSAWIGSKSAVNTISGTSMASSHIAGVLAYYLSLQPELDSDCAVPSMTPKKMKEILVSNGTKNALTDLPSDTANFFAWNDGGSSEFPTFFRFRYVLYVRVR
ncbi:Subtilisin-like protease [Golovinomyces cichoracearum]|uniref:Subtilisin-like protease n=1 Tax=Golovinomyces cichoracearum TaxID=62708 RepID=A0A420IYM3_9PEZI|nr:Subtilisin-like protease [Golovinomyces cichoracearum]